MNPKTNGDSSAGAGATDKDLDQLIEAMEKMKQPEELDGKSFEEQLQELENHPAFMQEWDPSKPVTPEMEGLMKLKYECEDPTAKAEAYKEDGNHEFKKKQYHIAVDNYTEGIKCKCPDKQLNAILYTNRAAAQFYRENYRSAFNDCIFAEKFKPDHFKAIHRGAKCCLQMKKYDDCIKWCDKALNIDPENKEIKGMRQDAINLKKSVERDKRKVKRQEKKELEEDLKLIQAIQKRGIKLAGISKEITEAKELNPALLATVETHNPHGAKVHLDAKDVLYWPVLFLYPEFTETDYIQMFCEYQRIIDQLTNVFDSKSEPPYWDKNRRYKPHTVNVYFEEKDKLKLHKVNKESKLVKVLQHESYIVYGGTPAFILTVAGSEFEKSFLKQYTE